MKDFIKCRINGHNLRLKKITAELPKQYGRWSSKSHAEIVTHKDNSWPWRLMELGDCVHIPYKYTTYKQMQNSINGYTRHARGVKFRYRSQALGLTVWCIEREGSTNE